MLIIRIGLILQGFTFFHVSAIASQKRMSYYLCDHFRMLLDVGCVIIACVFPQGAFSKRIQRPFAT